MRNNVRKTIRFDSVCLKCECEQIEWLDSMNWMSWQKKRLHIQKLKYRNVCRLSKTMLIIARNTDGQWMIERWTCSMFIMKLKRNAGRKKKRLENDNWFVKHDYHVNHFTEGNKSVTSNVTLLSSGWFSSHPQIIHNSPLFVVNW